MLQIKSRSLVWRTLLGCFVLCQNSGNFRWNRKVCFGSIVPEYLRTPLEVAHFNQSDLSNQSLLLCFEDSVYCPSSRSQSCKRPYDLVKKENRSHKRSHKLDRIRVRRITTFSFLIPFTTLSLMIQWKLGSQGLESNIRRCILSLLLATWSYQSDRVISRISVLLPTPLVWFSLLHFFKLLITTPTATPSLMKTSL